MASLNELNALRDYYNTGITKEYSFRLEQLKKLKTAMVQYEEALYAALYHDLKKNKEECWATENGFVMAELNNAIKKLSRWMRKKRVGTNLFNFPSQSFILPEPLGVVFIISPWNYPVNLLLTPLVGAMAAGNCVVLKSSEFAPASSAIMKKMIEQTFDKEYILFVEGDGATVVPAMLNNFSFDHIFYTGSTQVGKIIYEQAAKKLVPVTLELGGKSPCVVEEDASIKVAARRIAMTKFSNAGQMCVAPDYILVHQSVKETLENELKKTLQDFFGSDAKQSKDFGKIINEKQFDRLIGYLNDGKILYGGNTDKNELYIEPTLMDGIKMDAPIMTEEIFGPILPIISFSHKDEAMAIIEKNKNPLAFYLFTGSSTNENFWLKNVAFGGGCINNASVHLTNHHLPFGGRGFSGTGQYHGRYSFNTFSHYKGVLKSPTYIDPSIKYPPNSGKLKLLKWIIK
ncbi:MAG: aldehyde dehydrogenase [Bacteroidetes bacterium]|nr:aldehyde dehydrogenase [Bacteroidota bacterium]MBS1756490.1 aldehyde dehydrogenase [Bacteroidota bacterium]